MLDSTFKDLFVCVRVYDNSSTSTTATPVYSLPTQRVVCSTQDFLVSFGKVGMRRKKVLGSWISLNRYDILYLFCDRDVCCVFEIWTTMKVFKSAFINDFIFYIRPHRLFVT